MSKCFLYSLIGSLDELGKHGPMKSPEATGIDELQEKLTGNKIEKGQYYDPDPMGLRTGNGPGPELRSIFTQVIQDVETLLNPVKEKRAALSVRLLREKVENFRGVVAMAYPGGLPEWDTVRLSLDGTDGLKGTAAVQNVLDPDTTELWVASRKVDRTQTLAERFGKNEKTKVVGKLQRAGAGAPGREPGVSEEEKKAMMAFYFKKQEEAKLLAENSDDEYLFSSWADPKQLQRSLRGQGASVHVPGTRV